MGPYTAWARNRQWSLPVRCLINKFTVRRRPPVTDSVTGGLHLTVTSYVAAMATFVSSHTAPPAGHLVLGPQYPPLGK